MWDCIAEIAARGGLEVAQPWPATAEKPSPKRRSPSATRSLQQGDGAPFLDVRTAVLNDTLEDVFRRRYPGFRPANGDEVIALAG
jgi:hypothetical protein